MEKEFWDKRWKDQTTKWDMGKVSPPLKTYIDQLTDKSLRILIPGCGNAYEAEYLWEKGFKNTFIVEISQGAIQSFKKRFPAFPDDQIFHEDFFEFNSPVYNRISPFIQLKKEGDLAAFDLILEQTFFCAISPEKRANYSVKMHDLLKSGGKLVGVMMDFPLVDGPPFGGTVEEYKGYFEPYFDIPLMEPAHNSIKPRQGRELFVKMIRK